MPKPLILADETYSFCTFWLKDRLYAVNLLDVREVSQNIALTPIYQTKPSVRGYMNIRGQIHLVLDLRVMLNLEPAPLDGNSCVIMFKTTIGESFGILVDRIRGVETVPKAYIEEFTLKVAMNQMRDDSVREFAWGICKLEQQLMIVLESRSFLDTIALLHKAS